MGDARLEDRTEDFVSYYDAGSGVYLTWSPHHGGNIAILSLDQARVLAELPTGAASVEDADGQIREWIEDSNKDYGVEAGLWDPAE